MKAQNIANPTNRNLYKKDTSVKQTPPVPAAINLLPLFDSV